jgi:glycyl-tRNA synthetase beta subunit
MSVPAFLDATEPLIAPLDTYFDKVFVMCEDEVGHSAALSQL